MSERTQQHFHGSDLEKIEAVYGIKKETIINYSANVNPMGLSKKILETLPKHIELIASYPDREYRSLRKIISEYVNISPDYIIVGNGTTELISLCIRAVSPRKTVIIGPTYSEYEREASMAQGEVLYYPLDEALDFNVNLNQLKSILKEDVDMLILCNPNNPTSTYISCDIMANILSHCQDNRIFVMVDETYIEFVTEIDDPSCIPLCSQFDNLMVLRGVSKFFSAPGLRLGYGVCSHPYYSEKINSAKNPWAINALSAYAGELMLSDQEYITNTKAFVHEERKRIVEELSSLTQIKVYHPSANFILVKLLTTTFNSHTLFEKLLKQRLMIRDVSGFRFMNDRFIRFCLLTPEENDLLLGALRAALKQ